MRHRRYNWTRRSACASLALAALAVWAEGTGDFPPGYQDFFNNQRTVFEMKKVPPNYDLICPKNLSEENKIWVWENLRDKIATELVTDPTYAGTEISERVSWLNEVVAVCEQNAPSPHARACMASAKNMLQQLSGSMAEDRELKFTAMPEWLKKDKKLLKLLQSITTVEEARKRIELIHNKNRPEGKKILTFMFKPTIEVGGRQDVLRLMVIDPDDKGLKKWGLFEFSESAALEKRYGINGNYAVFAWDPKTKKYYSNDFERDRALPRSTHYRLAVSPKKCTQCHKSGPISVNEDTVWPQHRPDWRKSFAHHSGDLEAPMEGGGVFDFNKYGPPIGDSEREGRNEPFFRRCLGSFPEGKAYLERLENSRGKTHGDEVTDQFRKLQDSLRGNMNCKYCHGGRNHVSEFGAAPLLAWPIGLGGETSLSFTRIHGGGMPRDEITPLSDFEKNALANCLSLEQFGMPADNMEGYRVPLEDLRKGRFFQWMTNVSCKDGTLRKAPAATPSNQNSESVH